MYAATAYLNASIASAQVISDAPEVSSFFRYTDPYRPRLGFVLDSEIAGRTGMNFEFCDGERVQIDFTKLTKSSDACSETREGPLTWAYLENQALDQGISVFDQDHNVVGVITNINTGEGTFSAEAQGNWSSYTETSDATELGQIIFDLTSSGVLLATTDDGVVEALISDWESAIHRN